LIEKHGRSIINRREKIQKVKEKVRTADTKIKECELTKQIGENQIESGRIEKKKRRMRSN